MGSLTGNKKMRKRNIQDRISILQCIISGEDKDPIQLLDEAIRCLKCLKLKTKLVNLMPCKLGEFQASWFFLFFCLVTQWLEIHLFKMNKQGVRGSGSNPDYAMSLLVELSSR